MTAYWQHFRHGADIGLRGTGDSPAAAFEQTALAMTAVVTDPTLVRDDQTVSVRCEAPDLEVLLVDWLNALVYEMAERGMLFGRYAVTIEDNRLDGTAWGEPVDRARHRPVVEVKGATYTALSVRRIDGVWVAECVVDV